jgi:hypothetical protein
MLRTTLLLSAGGGLALLLAVGCGDAFTEASAGGGGAAGGTNDAGADAAGASGTGGSGTGGSGGVVSEDCSNGTDDDDDGAVDCADSDCVGYRCVPKPPLGWSGPVALRQGGPKPFGCDGDWPTEDLHGGDEVIAEEAACTACACGEVTGLKCGMSTTLKRYSNSSCSIEVSTVSIDAAACTAFGPATAVVAGPMGVSGGSCAPSGGKATLADPKFSIPAQTCQALFGGGCENGSVNECVPPLAADQRLCVYRADDESPCPPEYPDRQVMFSDIKDERDCSPCTCSGAEGGSCSATTTLYTDGACGSVFKTTPNNGTSCTSITGVSPPPNSFGAKITSATATGGSCAAGGGSPTGQAIGSKPIALCCEALGD